MENKILNTSGAAAGEQETDTLAEYLDSTLRANTTVKNGTAVVGDSQKAPASIAFSETA